MRVEPFIQKYHETRILSKPRRPVIKQAREQVTLRQLAKLRKSRQVTHFSISGYEDAGMTFPENTVPGSLVFQEMLECAVKTGLLSRVVFTPNLILVCTLDYWLVTEPGFQREWLEGVRACDAIRQDKQREIALSKMGLRFQRMRPSPEGVSVTLHALVSAK